MQKILRKRVFRDLKENLFRYLALGLLIILCMYMIGSLVGAGETIVQGVDEQAEKNHVEDGQFTCFVPLSKDNNKVLAEHDVELEKMFYLDFAKQKETIRVFQNRQKINLVALREGRLAEKENEIVLERRYAEEHQYTVGSQIMLGKIKFQVTGIATTPDYDAPLRKMSDTIVDSKNFGTAFVGKRAYNKLKQSHLAAQSEEYLYAYRLKGTATSDDVKDILNDFKVDADEISDSFFQDYWERTGGKVTDIDDGIDDLSKGAKKLADGLRKLNRYKNKLNLVPEKLFESALEQTEDALKENGTSVSLTEKNYTDELNHMITSQSGITAMAWKSAKENLDALKQYKDGLLSYTDGVEKAGEGASKLQDGMDELKNGADEFIDEIDVNLANLQSFVTAEDNPRIGASADDQKINISAGLVFGVILIVLFAYVISVFTIHSIEKESSIIGTLYALGGARRELMHHYLMLPVVVTTLAGILGFLAAVSPVGIPVQMQDCLAYFSMPEITVQVPVYLILYGVFMPPVMACVVNYIVIRKKLSRTALSLMRNETKKKKQKTIQLGKMSFLKMFRIRQMLRESRAGITVAVGMFIALLCMMISLDCYELCIHVRDNNIADTNYNYMYTLKYPEKEVPDGGSPALAKTMKKQIYGYNWDVTVLGIEKGNSYFDANVEKGKGKVVASSALAQKYELSVGDEFTLKDEETDTLYAFEVTDICQYAPAFYVFMDIDSARDLFGEQDDYYNTIFSNKDLKIPSGRLYATTTKEDIEKSADVFMQMMVSMVITITIVSTLIFILVMYLMMKVMIDRSAYSISLMKVFGFRTKEIRKLYLDGNFYIVLISAIVNIPLSKAIMDWMYPRYLVSNIACGLDLSFEPWLYVAVFALIMICYFVINRVLVGRLKKMTPAEVLKNRE